MFTVAELLIGAKPKLPPVDQSVASLKKGAKKDDAAPKAQGELLWHQQHQPVVIWFGARPAPSRRDTRPCGKGGLSAVRGVAAPTWSRRLQCRLGVPGHVFRRPESGKSKATPYLVELWGFKWVHACRQ